MALLQRLGGPVMSFDQKNNVILSLSALKYIDKSNFQELRQYLDKNDIEGAVSKIMEIIRSNQLQVEEELRNESATSGS